MATPIKETPFLTGQDAKNFIQENKEVKRVSQNEMNEIKANFDTLMSMADDTI